VSLAAVVVLSVTIVTMMREEGVEPLQDNTAVVVLPPAAPAAAPAKPAAAPAPAELAKEAPAAPPTPAPAVAPTQAARAPAPEPKKIESAAIASAERVRPELSPVPQTAVAGARPPAADSVADAAVGAREDRAAAAASAPQTQRRAAPAALMAEKSRDQAVLGRQAEVQESAVRPAEPDPLWRDLEREPAEKWLERLRSMRRDGREQDFGRLLAEFRRRFPDRELPDELR